MTVCNFIILVCLWIAIGIISTLVCKMHSIITDIKITLDLKNNCNYNTKYVPFFDICDKKIFREILQDCLQNNDVAFELENIINNTNTQEAVKNIIENYNITPKEKEE